MFAAGLSPYLRDSIHFVQADGQKNFAQDPVLREKRDPAVAERHKEAANTLRRNWQAPFLPFPLDPTVERAKSASTASFETRLHSPPERMPIRSGGNWLYGGWKVSRLFASALSGQKEPASCRRALAQPVSLVILPRCTKECRYRQLAAPPASNYERLPRPRYGLGRNNQPSD